MIETPMTRIKEAMLKIMENPKSSPKEKIAAANTIAKISLRRRGRTNKKQKKPETSPSPFERPTGLADLVHKV